MTRGSVSRCRARWAPPSSGTAIKRLLRETWRELLPEVPAGHDYVLVARPGIAEPAQARGADWLPAEIAEALERVRS